MPVAVEMLMKALALGPRRDQRHPGPRCPPDRRDYVSGATANVARVIEFACVLKSGVTKRSTSNVFSGHGTRREHKAVESLPRNFKHPLLPACFIAAAVHRGAASAPGTCFEAPSVRWLQQLPVSHFRFPSTSPSDNSLKYLLSHFLLLLSLFFKKITSTSWPSSLSRIRAH